VNTVDDTALRAVWQCELDLLELDVRRIEQLPKDLETAPTGSWTPPAIPGRLPVDLVPRAEELLDRQDRARRHLATALAATREQLSYVGRVSEASGCAAPAPVYVDVDA
jgi:hypothetical protein